VNVVDVAIGVDVGGTKIAAGLVRLRDGVVLERLHQPTAPARGGAAVLDDALGLARQLWHAAEQSGFAPGAIGVALCELIDPAQRPASGHTVDWRGLAARERFAELAPTTFEADVRAHAIAEARVGAGQAHGSFAFISIGTGISSTIMVDGAPWRGARGNALVLASSPHPQWCSRCGTHETTILEDAAAGPAILARYRAAGGNAVDTAEVLARIDHDPRAAMVVGEAAAALGSAIGWLVDVVDPAAVVLGGGLGSVDGVYHDWLCQAIRAAIYADDTRRLPIERARCGADAGVIGAALAAGGHR